MSIVTSTMYIDSDVKQKVRVKLEDWFGDIDDNELGYL